MDNKVVVITGASSGIGAALAGLLASRDHQVILTARRERELKNVAKKAGHGAVATVADVTNRADVQRVKDEALKLCGKIDVWINNAGRGITRPVLELSDDDLDEMIRVNLKSALYGMQAIVPYFKRQGQGHLINISSFLGQVPLVSFRSAYSAAKAALNVLTANLRMDLREQFPDIHVSLVMPGVVLTDFHKNALGSMPRKKSGGSAPTNAQTAEEVATTIALLIDHPKSEIYTNPASAELARRYHEDIDAFEKGLLSRG